MFANCAIESHTFAMRTSVDFPKGTDASGHGFSLLENPMRNYQAYKVGEVAEFKRT